MSTPTEEQLAKISEEEQQEYRERMARIAQREEAKRAQEAAIKAQKEAEKAAEQAAKEAAEKEPLLSKAYGAVKPIIEPVVEMGLAAEKGFEQGLLSGAAEEARAAAISAAGGDYEASKKEQEAAFKKSEKESPVSTFLGELGGSIAQGTVLTAATGGSGLPLAIANAVSKLSKLGKVAKAVTTVAKPIARVATTAAIGAGEGAIQGAFRSEKSLAEQRKEGFKEAKAGAKSGAMFGGAIQGVSTLAKGTAGVAGDYLSKKMDEGKLFPSAKPIREAWRYGLKNIGFSSEESLARPAKKLMKVIEKDIQPKIQTSMSEVKELSDYILQNVPKKIEIEDIVQSGISKLKSEGHVDANKFADYISNKYKAIKQAAEPNLDIYGQPTGVVPKISLMDAKLFIRDLQNELKSKPQTHANFQDTIRKITKEVDSMIDSTLTDADAAQAVLKDPQQTLYFLNILRKASPKNLAQAELNKVSGAVDVKQAEKRALELAQKIKKGQKNLDSIMKKIDTETDDNKIQIMTSLLEDPRSRSLIEEAAKNLGPVKILDSKMKNILSAQELLTGELFPKTDVEKAEQVMNLFRMLSGQTKEGVTSDVNRATYDRALTLLGTAFPEIANEIDTIVKPITDDLFMVRYLHGMGFDPALKDTAVVQKVLGPTTKLGAQTANISAQISSAAKKGIPGPIVGMPTSFLIRPTVRTLKYLQQKAAGMQGPVAKMISEKLQDAINSPDEGRRIAVLNTLMAYESFRNMARDVETEE